MRNWQIVAIVFFLCSCGSGDKETSEEGEDIVDMEVAAEEALYNEVMALHNEVMPRLKEIAEARNKIVEKIDALEEGSAEFPKLDEAVSKLDEAEESMMDWMRKFRRPADSVAHDQVLKYLNEQKLKIEIVKERLQKAIIEAKKHAGS